MYLMPLEVLDAIKKHGKMKKSSNILKKRVENNLIQN